MNRFQFCFNFAFKFNLRRYASALRTVVTADVVGGTRPFASFQWRATAGPDLDVRDPKVGWCRLTLSNPC